MRTVRGVSWIEHLLEARQRSINERFEELVSENRQIGLELCATFSDWLLLGGKRPTTYSRLGFSSRKAFEEATGCFARLRNDVAHGRNRSLCPPTRRLPPVVEASRRYQASGASMASAGPSGNTCEM
jgi:hypothetical protein